MRYSRTLIGARRAAGVVVAWAVVGLLIALSGCSPAPQPTDTTEPVATQDPSRQDVETKTGLTVGTTEGPYYVTDTVELTDGNLNYTALPGDPIKVSGFVYEGTDTSAPIPNAKVEIWHADSTGNYHPNSNGGAGQYQAGELALRGYVLTDSSGRYEFTSIYPGYYQGRTRHIHVRASADGFGGVVTQIIVPSKPGDGTTPETDSIAQSLPALNTVVFTNEGGVEATTFDFHIARD